LDEVVLRVTVDLSEFDSLVKMCIYWWNSFDIGLLDPRLEILDISGQGVWKILLNDYIFMF